MTPKALRELCSERGMYTAPQLNTVLFFASVGWQRRLIVLPGREHRLREQLLRRSGRLLRQAQRGGDLVLRCALDLRVSRCSLRPLRHAGSLRSRPDYWRRTLSTQVLTAEGPLPLLEHGAALWRDAVALTVLLLNPKVAHRWPRT